MKSGTYATEGALEQFFLLLFVMVSFYMFKKLFADDAFEFL